MRKKPVKKTRKIKKKQTKAERAYQEYLKVAGSTAIWEGAW